MLRARYDKIMATVHNSKLEESEAIEETPKEHSSGLSNIESFSGLYPLDRNFLLVLVPIRDLKTFPPPPSHRVRSCPSRFLFCACRFEPFSFPPKLKCVRTFLLILRLNEAPFNPFRNFLELCTSQAGLCAVTNRRLTWRRDARDNNEISSVLLKCSSKQKECSSRSSVDAGKFLFKFLSLSRFSLSIIFIFQFLRTFCIHDIQPLRHRHQTSGGWGAEFDRSSRRTYTNSFRFDAARARASPMKFYF